MSLDIDRIHKSIKRVAKFLKKSPKHPTPEKIHDVRTSTRRLESTLDTLKLGKPRKRLQRELPRLRKRCGNVRDMDVLTGLAISVEAQGDDKDCLVQVIGYLGAQRAKQAKKLRTLAKQRGPSIRRNLTRLSTKVDRLAESRKSNPSSVDTENASALADVAAKLRFPEKLSKRNLHPYRLQIKELRYVLQLSEMQNQPDLLSTLGEVKDAIGEWHDWEELVVIASDLLDDGPQASLVQQLKKIANDKFEHALAVTNRMRSTYIDGKRRKTKSPRAKSKGRSIPFPVSLARSAMQA